MVKEIQHLDRRQFTLDGDDKIYTIGIQRKVLPSGMEQFKVRVHWLDNGIPNFIIYSVDGFIKNLTKGFCRNPGEVHIPKFLLTSKQIKMVETVWKRDWLQLNVDESHLCVDILNGRTPMYYTWDEKDMLNDIRKNYF